MRSSKRVRGSWPAAVCVVLGVNVVFAAPQEAPTGGQDVYHLSAADRHRIDTALAKASEWLVQQQRDDGAFHSLETRGVPALPLTAMALWALSATGRTDRDVASNAAGYLLSFQQEDGGIYDPSRGLVRYTAAIAGRALDEWMVGRPDARFSAAKERLDLFVYQNRELESIREEEMRAAPGATAKAIEKLRAREDLSPRLNQAVELLWRARQKPTDRQARWRPTSGAGQRATVTYDELLRYISEATRLDNPTVSRAHYAIRTHYTLEGNPDLTRRYGPQGFERKTAGLYYYYLTLARTLRAVGRPELRTVDGRRHDWARELSARLLSLQAPGGFWMNSDPRWWEGDRVLVTCYAMISLCLCRDVEAVAK